VSGSESSRERKGLGVKGPRSKSSREQIGQGPIGRFALGSELARERRGSVPVTRGLQLGFTVRIRDKVRFRIRIRVSDSVYAVWCEKKTKAAMAYICGNV